jgi:DNA-binding beta-propeller fold protein YncE
MISGVQNVLAQMQGVPTVADIPQFQVDPFWPKPLPNDWIVGQCAGVAVDADDNVWVIHRPRTLTEREAGAVQDPPIADCCVPAPSVLQFNPAGDLLQAWGGLHHPDPWPKNEHGIYIDAEQNVWIASNGAEDHVVMKLSQSGKTLLTIGEWGVTGGSNDTAHMGASTDICVDPEAKEAYISDGYRNRRIIVFDADTGAYKRHWGAYGAKPDDEQLPQYEFPRDVDTPSRHFRSPMHAVKIGNDGLVYTADRRNNRIQVFRKSGEFVKEQFMATYTLAMGSVWDIDFSPDPQQTFMYIADGTNMKVWILLRESLQVLGSFGRGGRMAGQFEWIHNLCTDSKGNVYTTEVNTGKRVQKFSKVG